MAREIDSEDLQRVLYDQIADTYDAHYNDEFSLRYRAHFLDNLLIKGIDLSGKKVLEAMCGTGQMTRLLTDRGARVTGLDISQRMIALFEQRWPQAAGVCASITRTDLPNDHFDCVFIVGGLHHLHPHVSAALTEIHRVLRPDGYLCFVEPHTGSIFDWLRSLWYKVDPIFGENEKAIDPPALAREFQGSFSVLQTRYCGQLGYLLILNSMAWRMPAWLKKLISPPLLLLERISQPLQFRFNTCVSISQWQKRASAHF